MVDTIGWAFGIDAEGIMWAHQIVHEVQSILSSGLEHRC